MRDASELPNVELRLVLLSACGSWADEEIRRLSVGEIDWSAVTGIASWELATSVLWRRLEAAGAEVEAESLAGLRITGMVEEFRMSELERRLDVLLTALDGAGIRTVLLKGAGIAAVSPDGFTGRPMGDVDLLVQPDQARRAYALALENGWAERDSAPGPEAYHDMPHLRPLVAADGLGLGLEIHTRLFPTWSPFLMSEEDVWERAEPVDRWPGSSVLGAEDQLIYACLHFAWSHAFRRGVWRMTRDAEILLSDPALDRRAVVARSPEVRGTSGVYWTLRLVGELVGRPLAPEIVSELRKAARPRMEGLVLRHLVQEALPRTEVPGTRTLRRLLWSLAIRPRAMGHGGSRPWSSVEEWSTDDSASATAGSVPARLRGFLSYSFHLSGLS